MPLDESSSTTHASQWVVIDNHFLRRPPLPDIQPSNFPDKWRTPKQIQPTHHTTSLGRQRKRRTTCEPPNDDARIQVLRSNARKRREQPKSQTSKPNQRHQQRHQYHCIRPHHGFTQPSARSSYQALHSEPPLANNTGSYAPPGDLHGPG